MATQIKKEKKQTWDPYAEMANRRKKYEDEQKEKERQANKEELNKIERQNKRENPKKEDFAKPSATQPPKQTVDKSWKPSQVGPTDSQKKAAREKYNNDQYLSRTAKRNAEESEREAKNKKLEYKKSQRNTSKGYQNMIKRREDVQVKKYEEAFGRKINKGWR